METSEKEIKRKERNFEFSKENFDFMETWFENHLKK
jgi:hypothetical protein